MLTEDNEKWTLDFEINKQISLRQFIGTQTFRELVKKAVKLINEQDRATCICLLDKIEDFEGALRTLIALQWSQITQIKPQAFTEPTPDIVVNGDDGHGSASNYNYEIFDRAGTNSRWNGGHMGIFVPPGYRSDGRRDRDLKEP